MLEWSKPTIVALVRVLEHLKTEYKLFSGSSPPADGGVKKSSETRAVWLKAWNEFPPVDLKFRLADINAFLYSLVPGIVCSISKVSRSKVILTYFFLL